MRTSKTWNCAMVAGKNNYGCAAAIASNDPAEYPMDGYGVEVSSYSSDTGDIKDVAGALLAAFVQDALDNGITSVLVFSEVFLYPDAVHRETVEGCTVDFVVMVAGKEQAEGAVFDPKNIRRKMAREALEKELAKLEENAGKIVFDDPPLIPGQYVLYKNGDRYELGRVKRVADDGGAFVWYSSGDTASKTPRDCLILLENARDILDTDLGGADARAMFPGSKKGGRA